MNSANARGQKRTPKEQSSKQVSKRMGKSKAFPWKLVFGVVAIIGAMALLSNPIDSNSFENGPSAKNSQNSLSGFSLDK